MAEGMTPQQAAQNMLGQFQSGDYMELLDKGLIKEQVKAAILGDQGAQGLANEIAGELAVELGMSVPEALAATQSAMGIKGAGAASSGDLGAGFTEGVDGNSTAQSTIAAIAKGIMDNKDKVKAAGNQAGKFWGEGFLATVGEAIPQPLIDVLVTLVTPAVWARIQTNTSLTEPAT